MGLMTTEHAGLKIGELCREFCITAVPDEAINHAVTLQYAFLLMCETGANEDKPPTTRFFPQTLDRFQDLEKRSGHLIQHAIEALAGTQYGSEHFQNVPSTKLGRDSLLPAVPCMGMILTQLVGLEHAPKIHALLAAQAAIRIESLGILNLDRSSSCEQTFRLPRPSCGDPDPLSHAQKVILGVTKLHWKTNPWRTDQQNQEFLNRAKEAFEKSGFSLKEASITDDLKAHCLAVADEARKFANMVFQGLSGRPILAQRQLSAFPDKGFRLGP